MKKYLILLLLFSEMTMSQSAVPRSVGKKILDDIQYESAIAKDQVHIVDFKFPDFDKMPERELYSTPTMLSYTDRGVLCRAYNMHKLTDNTELEIIVRFSPDGNKILREMFEAKTDTPGPSPLYSKTKEQIGTVAIVMGSDEVGGQDLVWVYGNVYARVENRDVSRIDTYAIARWLQGEFEKQYRP